MIIHQAIYGDQDGAYALLGTSLTDKDTARRICNVTDVIDRPVTKELTQPIIRGFAHNNYFLFIKSFPDNTNEKIRRGRVFSHVLIIELDELYQASNLKELLSIFPNEINKTSNLKPIEINNNTLSQTIKGNSREAIVINSLLDEDKFVWLGEDGYFKFLFILWASIPTQLRATLRIGVAFTPNKIDQKEFTNILYIHEGYENKWVSDGYRIVGKKDVDTFKTESSFLLAGQKEKARKIIQFIDTFKFEIKEINDLSFIESNMSFYEKLPIEIKFNELLVFSDFISQLSPNVLVAKLAKKKILDIVLLKIENANPKNIIGLKNINWTGFKDAENKIQSNINTWSETNLLVKTEDSARSGLALECLQTNQEDHWWYKGIIAGISSSLLSWRPRYAIILFDWFIDHPELINLLKKYIPNTSEVENSFVACWTKSVPEEVAQPLLLVAKKREWFTLFGLTSLQLFTPEESIKELLKIDTNSKSITALEKTSEFIDEKDFIKLALSIREKRLIEIAGEITANQPSLLAQLDVTNKAWQQIWLIAINKGCEPWQNIKEPLKKLFSLFDQVLSGSTTAPDLLQELSNYKNNDLSKYKRRKDVWSHLTGGTKSNFIKATTLGCIRLFATNKIQIESIEDEIIQQLQNTDTITTIISNDQIATKKKIQLFEKIPKLTEKSFISLLAKCSFSLAESKSAGTLIQKNRWKDAARFISHNKSSKNDLKPAYEECKSLIIRKSIGLLSIFLPDFDTPKNTYKTIKNIEKKKMTKILICVSTDLEMKIMNECFLKNNMHSKTKYNGNLVYFDYGKNNGIDLAVVRTQMGSGSAGGSAFAIEEALRKIQPNNVIAIGIAFGIDEKKQNIGDILVSRQVQSYELQRVGKNEIIPRGDKAPANPALISRCDAAKLTWKKANIHTGLILSGDKLVDSKKFKNSLLKEEPEAIGGEMEAAGIVSACTKHSTPWLIMKGICDWGEDKGDSDQKLACSNAFDLFLHIMKEDGWVNTNQYK